MDDTACQDVELAGRKDVTSRLVEVGVDAVQVDGPQGHAWRGHPRWDGHDVAMRLMEDNKGERKGWARDGRYAYHKLQEIAEASEDKRNVRVLDEYTWQDRVWRDRVKKSL